jgi:hypothetical protein
MWNIYDGKIEVVSFVITAGVAEEAVLVDSFLSSSWREYINIIQLSTLGLLIVIPIRMPLLEGCC